jgi:ABC-type oligopeptide transport system substrate-binding subunit
MARSVLVRKASVAVVAVLLAAVGTALAADAPRTGGVLRVGNVGEPPAFDARWATASITETLTNHIYEGLYSLDDNYLFGLRSARNTVKGFNDKTERVRFYNVWLEK